VMLKASAVNVVDMTLIPAMPGTITFRSCWLPCRIAPKKARKRSGKRKLKKAALGLRQNSLRSRRYCRHAKVITSGTLHVLVGVGRQLKVDVLERGSRHCQGVETFAAGQGRARELVQQRGRILGVVLG